MHAFLKVTEVADILRVSKTTVQRWCVAGKLPAARIGKHWRINGPLLKEALGALPLDVPVEGGLAAVIAALESSASEKRL